MSAMATTSNPVDGLLKFRRYYFVRNWGREVMFQVLKCCFLEGTSKSIREVLEDNAVPMNRKSPFTPKEIDKLSQESPENLDITALNKICQVLWWKRPKDPGGRLKDLMKKIKDERNAVSHEEADISQGDLEVKLKEFAQTLTETLDEAGTACSHHASMFSQMKTSIVEDIPKIQEKIREKYNPSKPEDCKRLQAEIEEFGDHLHDYIWEKSVVQLVPIYRDLCKILPFDWLCQFDIIDPCKIMVSLQINTDDKFHGSHLGRKTMIFDQREILIKKNLDGNEPKVVIISGDMGSGKTTLLCSLLEKWHKENTDDISGLSSFKMLLYMEFRKHDHDNIDDYLRDLFGSLVAEFGVKRVRSSVLFSKCLFLCDGYDEKNSKSLKLFEEILGLNSTTIKVVVTTRPLNTNELTLAVNRAKKQRLNLTILGIQEEEKLQLVRRLVSHLVKSESERQNLVLELTLALQSFPPGMKQILKNPLQLSLFILLHIECPDLRGTLTTSTSLFMELNKHKSKRLIEKLGLEKEKEIQEFEKFYKTWCLRHYLQEKYELGEDDVSVFKAKSGELKLNTELVMSTYFNIKHSRKGLEIAVVYCYRHRAEQEFAAAGAICDVIAKLYREERSELSWLKRKGKNIIHHVLMCFKHEMENYTGVSQGLNKFTKRHLSHFKPVKKAAGQKMYCEDEHIIEIMRFITGILYSTDSCILFFVIDDILSNFECTLERKNVDALLAHLVETNNDAKVTDVISKLIKESFGKKRMKLIISESFSCIPAILPKLQPAELELYLSNDVAEHPHLILALEAAVQNGIELSLCCFSFSDESEQFCDRLLGVAETCSSFQGNIGNVGIKRIPLCIKSLQIKVDFEALASLSERLPSLSQLESLVLDLHDNGSSGICLSSIQFLTNHRLRSFIVNFSAEMDKEGSSSPKRIVTVLNALWPSGHQQRDLSTQLNLSSNSRYTGDAVEMLLQSLEIQPLTRIYIFHVAYDAIKRKDELKSLCRTRGLGDLKLHMLEIISPESSHDFQSGKLSS